MAVVFAKESGDWSTTNTEIWGIWNDQTQQVEDYGQNPTADDDVFCNGYVLTLKMSATVKTLSNRKKYDYLNNDGGRIVYNAGYTLSANEIDFVQLSQTNGCFGFGVNSASVNCYIICPTIKIEGGYFCNHTYGNNAGWIITGNIYLKNSCLTDAGAGGTNTHLLTINGNVIGEGINYFVRTFVTATNGGWTIVVNGDCKLVGNDSVNNLGRLRLTITGCYRNLDNNRFTLAQSSTSSVALGSIEYYSTNNTFGMANFTQFSMMNPAGFYWHDITEPRSNPYFIVSNYDLQNANQYPPENRVVAGTHYAFDEKVGTFEVDYPPETVVLKDYVYDGGEMVGTLDLPQAPTTSDIVTAIKNDSDLGGKISATNTNVGNMSTAVTTIDGKVDIIDTNVDTLLSRLTSVLTQRLGQSVTVEILQQILVAHLNN